jgi:hypothetical protein
MKRILITILLGTFLFSLPVFASARETVRAPGEARQITGVSVAVPIFMQLRRRYYRRRYPRAYVIRRRNYRRAYVIRRRRRFIRRRF